MPLNANLEPTVIRTTEDVIKLIKDSTNELDFSNCDISLSFDLYEIIKDDVFDGIEIILENSWSDDDEIHAQLNPGFHVSNVRFTKPINFHSSSFHGPVHFTNVVFEYKANFMSSTIDGTFRLSEVKFNARSVFRSITMQSFSVHNSIISGEDYGFYNSKIEEYLLMERTEVNGKLDFNSSKIGRVDISGGVFNEVVFSNCKVGFFGIGPDVKGKSIFIAGLDLSDSLIDGQLQLMHMELTKCVARNCTFNHLVYFENVKFHGQNSFQGSVFGSSIEVYKVIIEDDFSFQSCTFHGDVYFLNLLFDHAKLLFTSSHLNGHFWIGGDIKENTSIPFHGYFSFQGAIMSDNSIVRVVSLNSQNRNGGELNISNAYIKGLLDLRNAFVDKIDFNGTIVLGNFQTNESLMNAIQDRKTATLFKHEAKKIDDDINALRYRQIEMSKYEKEININDQSERMILFFNRISNQHGLKWIPGVIFTLCFGTTFYVLYKINTIGFGFFWIENWNFLFNDKCFWMDLINYFWLPTGFNSLDIMGATLKGSFLGVLSYILGKIFIAYGIYQTIAAFRKHKVN